ncbi:MAG: DUF2225 domain-containing protein [Clostridia bacterium]|nr:DUF2225 domain-containing protein [Clostridia bacterium]
MNSALYNKAIQCPVCQKQIEITKLKASACKVASRDTDFCVYYQDLNPMFYEVWVCEFCGYAALSEKFEEIRESDAGTIKDQISTRWNKRGFAGERNIDHAIEAFKLALFNLQVRKAKPNEFARVCLRIAWLYRIKKDEKEKDFLNFALKYYRETYEKENLPIEKLDEFTCMYIIGELNRRVGDYEEAVKWFSRLIGSQEARKNASLMDSAREQFRLVKEQMEKR